MDLLGQTQCKSGNFQDLLYFSRKEQMRLALRRIKYYLVFGIDRVKDVEHLTVAMKDSPPGRKWMS